MEKAKIAGVSTTGGLVGVLAGIAINPILGGILLGATATYYAYKSIKNKINIAKSYNKYFTNTNTKTGDLIDFNYKVSKKNVAKLKIPNTDIAKNECENNLETYLLANPHAELKIKKQDNDKYSLVNNSLNEQNTKYKICDITIDSIIYPGDDEPKGRIINLSKFNPEILKILYTSPQQQSP
jgi:hypothetical protein